MRPGVPPSCQCGGCPLCKHREARRRYYTAHREKVIRENAAAKRRRQRADRSPEISDEEMDRRALVMMGRIQDAR
jgi:hypothetical protein